MNGVIYFFQRSLQVPVQFLSVIFFLFQALKFFYKIKLKLCADSRTKFKGFVFMGVCPSKTSRFRKNTNSLSFLTVEKGLRQKQTAPPAI